MDVKASSVIRSHDQVSRFPVFHDAKKCFWSNLNEL